MRLIDNMAHRLYLGVSQIPNAGIGVYTGIDIPSGIPTCEYKGDAFVDPDNNSYGYADGRELEDTKIKLFSLEQLTNRYMYTLVGGYTKIMTEYVVGHMISGCKIDAHPALVESPIGFGGYVNDRRVFEGRNKKEEVYDEDDPLNDGISRPMASLEKQLKDRYNVYYYNNPTMPIVYLISLRDIRAGEELFVDYGYPYWEMKKRREEDRIAKIESDKASELIKEALKNTRNET